MKQLYNFDKNCSRKEKTAETEYQGDLEILPQLVVAGKQNQVEMIIKKNPTLLLKPYKIKDLSGREFKRMSVFQYALWALDWHMWKMMLRYIPLKLANQQIQELESCSTEHGKYFSFQPLIESLKKYVSNSTENQWCKVVGKEQALLPAHAINEYCRNDQSFYPCPNFMEGHLIRTMQVGGISWHSSFGPSFGIFGHYTQGKCGDTFAFTKGAYNVCIIAKGNILGIDFARSCAPYDLIAMEKLSEVRINQLEFLKSQVLRSLALTNFFEAETTQIPKEIIEMICDYSV